METPAHQDLKRMAIAFLKARGCPAAACEVRCPIARFRVDAAGFQDNVPRMRDDDPPEELDPRRRGRWRVQPHTIVIECKQSRGDFIRDSRSLPDLLQRRRSLDQLRIAIEHKRIVHEEPHLRRRGESLFPQMDEWDFHNSRLPAYRRVLAGLRRLDLKIHGETKLHMMARYRLADRLYLAAPAEMIRPTELPPGWGLLECSTKCLARGAPEGALAALRVRFAARRLNAADRARSRLLRNIAVAACMRPAQAGVEARAEPAVRSEQAEIEWGSVS